MNGHISNASARHGIGRTLFRSTVVAAVLLAACNTDKLTEVETPGSDHAGAGELADGAAALRSSALGNFANFFAGDVAGAGIGMNIATGLLGDEMLNARGGTEHLDSRAVNEAVFPATVWSTFGQANTQLVRAIKSITEFAPASATKVSQIAQLYMLNGFTYVIVAEGYCNGIPVGNADDANPKTDILSNVDLFNRAIAQFDTALATAAATDTKVRNAALVGKARALVDLKRYADAATAVAAVTTEYVYNVEFSNTTIINDVYDWMFATPNFGPSDREGGNGLNYVSSGDPRIKVDATRTRPGQEWHAHLGDANVPARRCPGTARDRHRGPSHRGRRPAGQGQHCGMAGQVECGARNAPRPAPARGPWIGRWSS